MQIITFNDNFLKEKLENSKIGTFELLHSDLKYIKHQHDGLQFNSILPIVEHIVIYIPFINQINSVVRHNYFLEYKEVTDTNTNIYYYIDLQTFISELIKGSDTKLIELLFTKSFQQNYMLTMYGHRLYENRFTFATYSNLINYIEEGYEDLRQVKLQNRELNIKYLLSAYRKFLYYEMLEKKEIKDVEKVLNDYYLFLKSFDNIEESAFNTVITTERRNILTKLNDARIYIDNKLAENRIRKYIKEDEAAMLDSWFKKFMFQTVPSETQKEFLDLNIFYTKLK